MSVLRLLSLVLILALVLLASGCRGSMVIATLGDPDDDDSVLDDDDMTPGDDDDGAPDDDDVGPDDDDVDPPGDTLGYFYLQGTIQHPQGRFSDGYGYYYLTEGRDLPSPPAPLLVNPSLARGADFGCEVSLPDGDEGRGGEVPTYDAGLWAQFGAVNDAGEVWTHTMERHNDDGFIYYQSTQGGNPPAVPAGALLDFEVPGGDDIPAIEMLASFPTHTSYGVTEPALDPAEEILLVDPGVGLAFSWEPQNEEGVEIVLAFWDEDLVWLVECWLEDTGTFDMGPGLVEQMPSDLTGLVWFRRYVYAWHPDDGAHPDTWFSGALQHRWFAQMASDTDGR